MNAPASRGPLRIAFTCQPAVGHVNALLSIAFALRECGHDTRFLVPGFRVAPLPFLPDALRSAAEAAKSIARRGLPTARLPMPLAGIWGALRLVRLRGYAELECAAKLFTAGLEQQAKALVEHLRSAPPDAVVTDFTFFAAAMAAEKLEIPYAAVYHSALPFRGPGIPPFGSGLPIGSGPGPEWRDCERRETALIGEIARVRSRAMHRLGLRAVESDVLRIPYSPWLNLVTSHPIIEAPRDVTPSTVFVGPCLHARRGEDGFPFHALRPDAFKVYISLGTVFDRRPAVFRAIIEGLAGPGTQMIVSAGASLEALQRLTLPEGVSLFRRVPQVALLPRIDLVVGHGGNNTTNETLACGKPLLVVPVGGEQRDNARRVEYLGAGLSLELDEVTPRNVAARVRQLRASGCAAVAARLGEQLRELDGARTACALIERLARSRQPVGIDAMRENLTFVD
jgi:MGT family glycosyltransferase